jgi:FtsZ-binding cell division protein ZapB
MFFRRTPSSGTLTTNHEKTMQTENDTSKPENSPQQEAGEGCSGATCSASLMIEQLENDLKLAAEIITELERDKKWLIEVGEKLVRWVESPRHTREEVRDHNGRLKDTGIWASFYTAVRGIQRKDTPNPSLQNAEVSRGDGSATPTTQES